MADTGLVTVRPSTVLGVSGTEDGLDHLPNDPELGLYRDRDLLHYGVVGEDPPSLLSYPTFDRGRGLRHTNTTLGSLPPSPVPDHSGLSLHPSPDFHICTSLS